MTYKPHMIHLEMRVPDDADVPDGALPQGERNLEGPFKIANINFIGDDEGMIGVALIAKGAAWEDLQYADPSVMFSLLFEMVMRTLTPWRMPNPGKLTMDFSDDEAPSSTFDLGDVAERGPNQN